MDYKDDLKVINHYSAYKHTNLEKDCRANQRVY